MTILYRTEATLDDSNGEITVSFCSRNGKVTLITLSQGSIDERGDNTDDIISLEAASLRQLREILNSLKLVDEYTEE
jgi:hypothetical protein